MTLEKEGTWMLTEEILDLALERHVGALRDHNDRQFARCDARFDVLEARLDGIDSRLDGLASRMSALEARIGQVETRLGMLEDRVGRLVPLMTRARTTDAERIAVLEQRVEELEKAQAQGGR